MLHTSVQPYHIQVQDQEILDLRYRLKHTRFPMPAEGYGWQQGTDNAYLKDLTDYWATQYDWKARQAWMNSFPHYQAHIGKLNIHFIHTRSGRADAIPLLLMQGWPSSFVQVLDVLPLLNQYEDGLSFDVVAVSLPGYAFSETPGKTAMNFEDIADLAVELMVNLLGYKQFAARGSDQGALVQQQIGLKYPQHLIGLHRSGITPFLNPMPGDLTEEEKIYQQQVQAWAKNETAYASLQALRPETMLPALADSPAGLASWIIEKFQRWGDAAGDLDTHFGRDKLLDNISLHWFANSGSGAIRLYHEAARNPGMTGQVKVPTAIAMPLRDGITVPAPKSWAGRFYNVKQWSIMEKGGHFPEWEVPEWLSADIRKFFG